MISLIPLVILFAGALLVVVGTLLRFRHTPVVSAAAAALAMIAQVWVGTDLPHTIVLLAWRPVSLFGMPVVLNIDGYAWALGLCLLVPVLAASVWWFRLSPTSTFYPALILVMSAVMLVVVGAANLLTLVLAWGCLDVVYCIALLASEGLAGSRRIELVIGINGLAALSIWIALVFLEQDSYSPYWYLMTLSPTVQVLLGLASMLRLGLYPLYAWSSSANAPSGEGARKDLPQLTLLNLMSMAAGLSLWIRLAAIQAVPDEAVWVWAALVGSLLAGLLAWVQRDARQSIAYVAIGYAGLLIAAGSGIGVTAVNLASGVAAWLLAINLLAVGPAFNIRNWSGRLWGIPVLIALATLVGLPATIGMTYRTALHAALAGARWLWWGLVVLIEILLAGAAVRCALAPRPAPVLKDRSLMGWARALSAPITSLSVATLPLMIFGVWPAALFGSQAELFETGRVLDQVSGVRGWVGWCLPLVSVMALLVLSSLPVAFKQWLIDRLPLGSERSRSFLVRGSQVTRRILDLGWLYDLVMNSIRRAARLLSNLAALAEGKGALVWMLLLIVLALLYLSEPGR